MTLQKNLERIQEKMETLKHHPKKDQLFGAGLDKSIFGHSLYDNVKTGHEYTLNEPLLMEEVVRFEEQWRITLPDDYKLFVTTVGNGGMGPYYGLLPLELNLHNQENHLEDTICLAHEGCGYYHHLGVKDDKTNKIYVDLEAAGEGVHELNVTSFFHWYEIWLDHSLQTLDTLYAKQK